MRKAMLGAFVLRAVFGLLQTEFPWRGMGILANTRLMIGCGLGVAVLMVIIWSLIAVHRRVAGLTWRKRT